MIPWGVILLILAEGLAIMLTIRDPGFASKSDAITTSALWLIAAAVGVARAFMDSTANMEQTALAGAIVVFSIIVGTGGRPGLILGNSVRRDGAVVANLWWRRIMRWVAAGLAVIGAAVWIESTGGV
jgi:hypothetical protein